MSTLKKTHCPLLLRSNRLIDVFAKADDERDFYLDCQEGFLVYTDLDSPDEDLVALEKELTAQGDRFVAIPKLTFYETKKIMEGFTNEKVYDIDTKEKLLDTIQGKDAREQFLEFLHDNHVELDKWLQFYQERTRIRIIQWLREYDLKFVFEEDLDLPMTTVEKLKQTLFQAKATREVSAARKVLVAKAETYYSNEALNPRPKRGRPPKHVVKVEVEPESSNDFYTTVPVALRPFLYVPNITAITPVTFSARYDTEEEFAASMRASQRERGEEDELQRKLASLRSLSAQVLGKRPATKRRAAPKKTAAEQTASEKPTRIRKLIKRVTKKKPS